MQERPLEGKIGTVTGAAGPRGQGRDQRAEVYRLLPGRVPAFRRADRASGGVGGVAAAGGAVDTAGVGGGSPMDQTIASRNDFPILQQGYRNVLSGSTGIERR